MKSLIATIMLLAVIVFTGCATQPAEAEAPPPPFLTEHYQKLSDGRTVLCLYREAWMASYGGGPTLSCDWAAAVVHQ